MCRMKKRILVRRTNKVSDHANACPGERQEEKKEKKGKEWA